MTMDAKKFEYNTMTKRKKKLNIHTKPNGHNI